MKSMFRWVCACILIFSIRSWSTDIFVATNGSDAASGTIAAPVATLTRAIALVQPQGKGSMKTIYFRGGEYFNVNVKVDPFFIGDLTITSYPQESVILYGGQILTNWTITSDTNCWSAPLGTFPTNISSAVSQTTTWEPRMLLADDVVCKRARFPATGKFHYTTLSGTTLTYTNNFAASTNMELLIDNSWNDAEMSVVDMDTNASTMTLNGTVSRGANTADVHSFAVINTADGMTMDNQFWWDKTNNAIVFRPPAGKDPNTMKIIVPTTSRIIYVQGSGSALSTNINIKNLTFAVATSVIETGSKDDYGQSYSSTICLTFGINCLIDQCIVYGVGGNGIGTYSFFRNNNVTIQNCIVHDVGAGGIMFSSSDGCVVSNNFVYNTGYICQGGSGIISTTSTNVIVTKNTVTNCSGSGINSATTPNGTISFNFVSRCVKALRDMAGIYTGGTGATNMLINYNYISEINGTNSDNGGVWDPYLFGVYCDQYGLNPVVSSNMIFNCTRPFIYHQTTNGQYLNNFFVSAKSQDTLLELHNCDQPVAHHNVMLSQGAPEVDGRNATYLPFTVDENVAVQDWRSNVFFSVSGLTNHVPTNVVNADPLFTDYAHQDFSFQGGSPATAVDVAPLDIRLTGWNDPYPHRFGRTRIVTVKDLKQP